jgi:hypothetical protein
MKNEVQKSEPNKTEVLARPSESFEKFDTRGVVKKLESLMTDVTKEEATPDTVNAACNCAGRITDLLRIHLEVERMKVKFR